MAKKVVSNKKEVDTKQKVIDAVRLQLSKVKLPTEISLNNYTKITDPVKFFESHLLMIEGRDTASNSVKPYSDRLKSALSMVGINIRDIAKQFN